MLTRFLLTLFLLISNATLVFADDSFEGGLPQFNYSKFPEQVFWLLLIFCLLYLALIKIVIPRIKNIKHTRARYIDENIFNCNKNNKEASKLALLIQEKLTNSHKSSKEYLDNLSKELAASEQKKLLEIKESNSKAKQELNKEIEAYNQDFYSQLPISLKETIKVMLAKLDVTVKDTEIDNLIKQLLTKEQKNV